LEDFLGDLYQAKVERGDKLAAQILCILTQLLLFKDGERMNKDLTELASKCLEGRETSPEGLCFIAKFVLVKKKPLQALNTILEKELGSDQIYPFFEHLENFHSIERAEVRKGYKEEQRRERYTYINNIKIVKECFQFIAVIGMKYVESKLQNIQEDAQFSNFLGVFF